MKIQDQNGSIRPRRGRLMLLVVTTLGVLSLAACVPLKGAPPPAPADPGSPGGGSTPSLAITSLNPAAGPEAGGTSVTITGTAFTGATSVAFGGTSVAPTVNSNTSITAVAPAGTGTVDVTVTTPTGTSPNTAADDYRYALVPTITSLVDPGGNVAGGNTVRVNGTDFTGTTAVAFGANPATSFTVLNPGAIDAVVPDSGSTTESAVSVSVTTPGGTNADTLEDNYTYYPTPVITSLNNPGGPEAGGNTVAIQGSGFASTFSVVFGSNDATANCTAIDSQITCTNVPAGTGVVSVQVTALGGQSANTAADDYAYAPQPTVTDVDPDTGSTAGDDIVTITGTGFQVGAGFNVVTQVDFSGTPTPFACAVVSATELQCFTPAHASGFVTVRVTTYGGSSPNNNPNDFFEFV